MSSLYSNLFYNQPISILDSTASSQSSASLFLYGGLTVQGNSNLFTTAISGLTTITNSATSTSTSTGALIVLGGIATQDNLNVGNNAVISNGLTVGSLNVTQLFATNITASNISISTRLSSASIYAPLGTIWCLSHSVQDQLMQLILQLPMYFLHKLVLGHCMQLVVHLEHLICQLV